MNNFGRVVGGALHKLEKERDEARKERDELKQQLFDETTWRIAACQAHAILSRGIKKALELKNWPDFYKLYGDGLFATGVERLLLETMDAKNKKIKRLEKRNESLSLRKPKRAKLVSGRKHARQGSRSTKMSVSSPKA